jgi:hypothetical protein
VDDFAIVLRGVISFTSLLLVFVIIRVVREQYARGINDVGQDLRFAALALFCFINGSGIIDRRSAPITWRTWAVLVTLLVAVAGIHSIRRWQRQNPPIGYPPSR